MLTDANYNASIFWAGLLAVFYLIYNGFWYLNYVSYGKNYNYCFNNLHSRIINKIATYDEDFNNKLSKGKIVNTCTEDIDTLADLVDIIIEMIVLIFKLIIIIVIFFKANIWVGLFVLVLDIIYMIIMDLNNQNIAKHIDGQKRHTDKLTDLLSQLLTGLREVKTLNFLPRLNKKFDFIRSKWSEQYSKYRRYYEKKETILPNIVNLGNVLLYIILIVLVARDIIGIDILIMLVAYYETMTYETNVLVGYSLNLREDSIAIDRINSIVNYKNGTKLDFGDNSNDEIDGLVEFKNVNFKYKDSSVLKNITFKAKPNQITTIVGHSGSGKSTIVNLLLRLYKVDSGIIRIDGENIYDYNKDIYSSNVSVVNQKPFIFNMSIRDNLNLIDVNKENQETICQKIGIHDFIMNLPNGYNTILKENATDISGGQKQLISLARTLLSNAEILLFDEITSALDPQLVLHVTNILNDLKKDHTIIMITHKPELMKKADNLIVLNKGQIVGMGAHKDLIENNSYYKELQTKYFVTTSPVKY